MTFREGRVGKSFFERNVIYGKLQFSMTVYNKIEPAFTSLQSSPPRKLDNQVPQAFPEA